LRVTVIAVGRIKERGIREAADDYLARIRRYVPTEEIELRDGPAAEVHAVIARRIRPDAHVTALDERGTALTSEAFARKLERVGTRGKGMIVFLVGGADGLPPATLQAAHDRLSLSTMTLPHRLARLMLFEQIYRAMTILRGEPYSH
jgi:23S rRNA (pseudouridine1915-N3)-methyltransferase